MEYTTEKVLRDRDSVRTELAIAAGQKVIVKTLSVATTDIETLKLFEREGHTLQQLDHHRIPKVIRTWTAEKADGVVELKIAQEYIPGKNLSEWIESGRRFDEDQITLVGEHLLNILTYLHELNPPVLHRDIKTTNVILNDDNEVSLVDFGSITSPQSEGETIVGTYGYMPPEQLEGRPSAASDIYALGMTLITLATHREPWEKSEDPRASLAETNLSGRLQDALKSMTALDVTARPQNAVSASRLLAGKGDPSGEHEVPSKNERGLPNIHPKKGTSSSHLKFRPNRVLFAIACCFGGAMVVAMCAILAVALGRSQTDALSSPAEVKQKLQTRCIGKDNEACERLGRIYYQDGQFESALKLFKKSCNGGFARGCSNVGMMHVHGEGTVRDLSAAGHYFEMACEKEYQKACTELMFMYLNAEPEVPMDKKRVAYYAVKGCGLGSHASCNALATMHARGLGGLDKNIELSLSQYEKTCAGEDSSATAETRSYGCLWLGKYRLYGVGKFNANAQGAIPPLEAACDLESPDGCAHLGDAYREVFGAESTKAKETYNKACELGSELGCEGKNQLEQ